MNFESITQMAKGKEKSSKPEKSQEELRNILEKKLKSLEPTLQDEKKAYKQAKEDGLFDDNDDEPEGSGEARKVEMQKKIGGLLERAVKMNEKLESKEILPQMQEEISVDYTYTDPKTKKIERQEIITISLEKKLQEFLDFYQKTNIDLPPDFEDTIRDIWEKNQTEIEKAIEENGFDDVLIIPPTTNIKDLSEKMKMEDGYRDWIKANGTVQTLDGIPLSSQNVDKARIILVHKTQNLKDRPELKQTLNTYGKEVKLDQALSLEDYIVFQRKFFEETGKHLDNDGWTWLSTKSGARLVYSRWSPGAHKLAVHAYDLGDRFEALGVRPARCFF